MSKLLSILVLLCVALREISGHGRIADPPQRGSLWRHPEYDWANPGRQPDDNENFCGGRGVTDNYIGACGLCGDSLLQPPPRNHEIGGAFERGIIVRTYGVGQTITVNIDIAAGHDGWFEFRLCEYSRTGAETEACFGEHLLRFSDGKTRIMAHGSQGRNMDLQLPAGVSCERCVLQWSWFGEGSNQYYKNCADIAIR